MRPVTRLLSLLLLDWQLTEMAPTELAPDEDGNPVFCRGLAGFERDGVTEAFLKECPVRADQVRARCTCSTTCHSMLFQAAV